LKQEAFMNWGQIDLSWIQLKDKIVLQWGRLTDGDGKRVLSWIQLKDKIVLQWGRLTDGDGKRVDLIGAEMSRDGQSGDAQIANFHPDDHAKRGEFSLHIGC